MSYAASQQRSVNPVTVLRDSPVHQVYDLGGRHAEFHDLRAFLVAAGLPPCRRTGPQRLRSEGRRPMAWCRGVRCPVNFRDTALFAELRGSQAAKLCCAAAKLQFRKGFPVCGNPVEAVCESRTVKNQFPLATCVAFVQNPASFRFVGIASPGGC